MSPANTRCLVADDYAGFIAAVSDYLGSSGFEVVGHTGGGRPGRTRTHAVATALRLGLFH